MTGFGAVGALPLGASIDAVPADHARLLVAVYFEQDFVGRDLVPISRLHEAYDFNPQQVDDWLNALAASNLISYEQVGTEVQLTQTGRNVAVNAVSNGVQATLLTTFSDGATFSDGSRFSSLVPGPDDKTFNETRSLMASGQIVVDSSTWTGLSKTRIDSRNARQVARMIDRALVEISSSGAGNEQIMQAAAFLRAAKELVEAPQPPSELIWQLVSKAADIVGLMGLFFMIFAPASC
jgi:hypothetical protein